MTILNVAKLSILLASFGILVEGAKIRDPLNIFCGSKDCYSILGVERNSTSQELKKVKLPSKIAYRRLSLLYHPDKNKEVEAVEIFREISKANEVLSDTEQRELFNYYLDHPRDYFKVSGQYYYTQLPKADLRLIALFIILFLSCLLPVVQYQKYQSAIKYLTQATINNLGLKSGGTKQTLELYRRATEQYEIQIKTNSSSKEKGSSSTKASSSSATTTSGKLKMNKDPIFLNIVNQLVSEVQIEGGFRKPTYDDVLLIQILKSPYWFYLWAIKAYRTYILKHPLEHSELYDMSKRAVGGAIWDTLKEEEQNVLISREIWKLENLQEWQKEREKEEFSKRPGAYKRQQRYLKKNL